MEEIKIRVQIEGLKELTEAIRGLINTKGGQTDAAVMAAAQTASVGTNIPAPTVPMGTPMPGYPAAQPNCGQIPVQGVAPIAAGTQMQGPAVPVAGVPTTAMPQEYTIEQLQVAAAGLTGMGKMPQVMAILQRFGIQAMTELPRERYGEFAIALREAGAQI